MKRVLVIGAGHVAKPLVHYLLKAAKVEVTVASRTLQKAEALVQGTALGTAIAFDMRNLDQLADLVAHHDLVVSMVPYRYNPTIARVCIEYQRPFVSTSYVSDEMAALDSVARNQGVLLLNEIGLDPGIDHMIAMKWIHRITDQGGTIRSFESFCGGIPAPESDTNPWHYKFSWSPRGVLLAATQPARFVRDGQIYEIPSGRIFDYAGTLQLDGLGTLEVYPNRDALHYRSLYHLPDTETLFRGTLRWPGWSETMKALHQLGFFSQESTDLTGFTYASWVLHQVGGQGDPCRRVAEFLGVPEDHPVIHRLQWLGLFDDVPVPFTEGSPMDLLLDRMEQKLQYGPKDRDLVVMETRILASLPNQHTEEIEVYLMDQGVVSKESAVSRTVALPAAIASRLILEGKLTQVGVQIPVSREIYEPVLSELRTLGIQVVERRHPAPLPG